MHAPKGAALRDGPGLSYVASLGSPWLRSQEAQESYACAKWRAAACAGPGLSYGVSFGVYSCDLQEARNRMHAQSGVLLHAGPGLSSAVSCGVRELGL